jgi:hypothetical protein
LLELFFFKKLWVDNGYFSNEEEIQGKKNFMNHKDV